MADEAAITIVMRLRDEASAALQGFTAKLQANQQRLQQAGIAAAAFGAALTGMAFLAAKTAATNKLLDAQMARVKEQMAAFSATAGKTVLPFFLALGKLLENTLALLNRVPEPLLRIGGLVVVMSGSFVTIAGTAALFLSQIVRLTVALRALGVTATITQAIMTGGLSIALVVGALAAGAAVAAGTAALTGGMTGVTTTSPATSLAMPRRPEKPTFFQWLENPRQARIDQVNVNINAGALMGNEEDARRFSRMVSDRIRSEGRVGR